MSPRELFVALCALRPEWQGEVEAILADRLFYPALADLGRRAFEAQLEGTRAPWIDAFYAVVERGLREGDDETKNLIVVGLFESLQGQGYHRGEADLIERRLGASSLQAWGDLLQGWTGGEVRTLAAWRRVIRNGPLTKVRWERAGTPPAVIAVDWTGAEPRLERDGRASTLDAASARCLCTALSPWLAEAVVAAREVPAAWDETLELESGRGRTTLYAIDRWVYDGDRWFEASIAALPWPASPEG